MRPRKIRQRLPLWPGDLTNVGSYGHGDKFQNKKPPGHAILEEVTSSDAPTGRKFIDMTVRFEERSEVSRLTADVQDADRLTAILNGNKGQTLDYIANLDFDED